MSFKRTDYRGDALAERNNKAKKVARQLGLIGLESEAELPPSLCQKEVARERELAQQAMRRFYRWLERGHRVHFVTVCRPEWTCEAGELTADHVRQVRAWMSRRARNLSRFGQQRMMGFVDIAWNDRSAVGGPGHWDVHAHVLVYVTGLGRRDQKSQLKKAFACRGDGDRVKRPLVIKAPPTDIDLLNVGEYNSRALLLEHFQRRRSYIGKSGRRETRDAPLRKAELLELAMVVNDLGPKPFWILSGLRRKHGRIMRHDSPLALSVKVSSLKS
jgi:hypothetical protein